MLASAYRGASSSRLRTHPQDLIRVMPAKGVDGSSTLLDDCRLRLGRRRRDPGGLEGVRGRRLLRDERDRGADRAEHARGRRSPGAADELRRGPARGRLRRHRRRRRQDGDALLPRGDRDRGRLPLRAPGAARGRPGDGRELRCEAPRGRCGQDPRLQPLSPRNRGHAELAGGRGAGRRERDAGTSSRSASTTSARPR